MKSKKKKLKKPRNKLAVIAHNKKATVISDKRKSRGGAKNKQAEILKDE